jgi:pilus assembly protein CpaB
MRFVFGLVLLLGVALAGFAVYSAQSYVEKMQQELTIARANEAPAITMVNVLVAARPLRYGERVSRADILVAPWPEHALPADVFSTAEEFFGPNGEERVVLRAMEAREVLLPIKLSEPGADSGITSRLNRGMRAFTIDVDVTTGVSGFLRPGDNVDVYWTGRTNENGEMTRLIQTQLRLIAVDQSADQDIRQGSASIARNVTVEASPQQVAALAQAQSTGRLSLALVGLDDETIADNVEMNQRTLLGIAEDTAVAAEAQVCTIRTRRGAELVMIEIPCTN